MARSLSLRQGYPVLMFTPTDEAAAGMRQLGRDLDDNGCSIVDRGRGFATGGTCQFFRPTSPKQMLSASSKASTL